MRLLIIILSFCLVRLGFSQDENLIADKITIEEEYKVEDYNKPKSILLYSFGYEEQKKYYDQLNNLIVKRLEKQEIVVDYNYEISNNVPKQINSFDDFNIDFQNSDYETFCLVFKEYKKSTFRKVSTLQEVRTFHHNLYITIIKSGTNKVISRLKLSVAPERSPNSERRKLSKFIANYISDL